MRFTLSIVAGGSVSVDKVSVILIRAHALLPLVGPLLWPVNLTCPGS